MIKDSFYRSGASFNSNQPDYGDDGAASRCLELPLPSLGSMLDSAWTTFARCTAPDDMHRASASGRAIVTRAVAIPQHTIFRRPPAALWFAAKIIGLPIGHPPCFARSR
jgi:hypothetical protein